MDPRGAAAAMYRLLLQGSAALQNARHTRMPAWLSVLADRTCGVEAMAKLACTEPWRTTSMGHDPLRCVHAVHIQAQVEGLIWPGWPLAIWR